MRISWDNTQRFYSQGVSMGVFYPQNSPGVAWNGLISVVEKGDDNTTPLYMDGQKYKDRAVPGTFSGTLSALTYPDEFEPYIGNVSGLTGQLAPTFGLCYRSNREIHLIYNAQVSPSNDEYVSLGGDVTPVAFSWDFTTMPEDAPAVRATSHIVIALDWADAGAVSDLEDIIYGDGTNDPSMPEPADVVAIFESHALLAITDNGDGTWTATGDASIVVDNGDGSFSINWPSAIFLDSDTYLIYSL